MQRYMLDTNIVSHLLRQQPQVVAHVMAVPMQALCISAVTESELLFGLAKRPEAHALHTAVRELLRRVESIAWDSTAAVHYGPTRAQLQKRGKTLDSLDLLIASQALGLGATLVTNDQAFQHVVGLHVEDWTLPDTAPVRH